MLQQVLTSSLVLLALAQAAPQEIGKGLPVLFQFCHRRQTVTVFRGAELKQAIAAGVVKGFGSLGSDSDSDAANAGAEEERDGRSDEGDDGEGEGAGSYAAPPTTTAPPPPPPTTTTPPPPPPTTQAYVAPVTVAPTYPAPVVYRPAPVAYKPAATYKPYVDQYADVPAVYTWEYAVQDDYTSNNFGAKEGRDGYLTNGKYYVNLPDGRLQTVTYTVDGGNGYVPVVEYSGVRRVLSWVLSLSG